MAITKTQFEAACRVASQVFAGKRSTTDGAISLATEWGLNETSARDFIYDYKMMMEGRVFHRAMSAPAMEHFLHEIAREHGTQALLRAIAAVELHIEYYEGHYKVNLRSMRAVVQRVRSSIAMVIDLNQHLMTFDEAVEKSSSGPHSVRLKRLQEASGIPRRIRANVEIFDRNPDVVAEVLFRANGVCEGCCAPAPFKRKSNGSPYLEVHHVMRLADGGKDTVENAIALCPNCHRKSHFG